MMSDDLKDWYSKQNTVDPQTLKPYDDNSQESNRESDKEDIIQKTDKAFMIASYIDRGLPFFNEYFRLLIEDLLSKSQAGFPRELYVRHPSSTAQEGGSSSNPEEINKKALADNKQAFIKFVKLLNSLAIELEKGNSNE